MTMLITMEQEQRATEILLDKLKEMGEVLPEDCESIESYGNLCSTMGYIYKTLTNQPD